MAVIPTVLYRGTLTTSSATLHTASAGQTSVISSILVTNRSASAATYTLAIDGIYIAYQMPIAAYQTISLDIKQAIPPTKALTGLASANSTIDVNVSGVQIAVTGDYSTGIVNLAGAGSPEGAVTGPVGSTWRQTNHATLPNLLWKKLSGTGNTGWYPDFEGRWTSYTPTLTASTTNPTNWTQTGYFMQAGKLVVVKFRLVAGASMTAGSGTYRVALPVNAAYTAGTEFASGGVEMWDASANTIQIGIASPRNTAYLQITYPGTTTNTVGNAAPWTWAANDTITGTITYDESALPS